MEWGHPESLDYLPLPAVDLALCTRRNGFVRSLEEQFLIEQREICSLAFSRPNRSSWRANNCGRHHSYEAQPNEDLYPPCSDTGLGANLRAASVIWEWVRVNMRAVGWLVMFATHPIVLP